MRKKSWISRNKFQKEDSLFSLKIIDISQNRKIMEHLVFDPFQSLADLSEIIKNNKLEYVDEVIRLLEECKQVIYNEITVSEFNILTTKVICDALNIRCHYIHSSTLDNTENLTKSERLVSITRHFNETSYLNLESGQILYDPWQFNNQNIKLYINNTKNLKTKLQHDEFYRSILYLISAHGLREIKSMLASYTTRDEIVS